MIPIERIVPGDVIWSEGSWQEIKEASRLESRYPLELTTHLGSILLVAPDCQFEVLFSDGTIRIEKASNILRSYILVDTNRPFSKLLPRLPACSKQVPTSMTVELAYLYGAFVGRDISRIPLLQNASVRKRIDLCLLACFGSLPKYGYHTYLNLESYAEIFDWLKSIDITGSFGYMRRCSRSHAIAFLRGLWDCRGQVSMTLDLGPFRQSLFQEIQDLLLDFDIVSTIRKDLLVLDDKRRFLTEIGLTDSIRMQALLEIVRDMDRKWPLRVLYDRLRLQYRSKIPNFKVRNSFVSTDVFATIYKLTEDPEAAWLLDLASRCIAVEVTEVRMSASPCEIYEIAYRSE